MKKAGFLLLLLTAGSMSLFCQTAITTNQWEQYSKIIDKKPAIVTVDMNLINHAPVRNFTHVFIVHLKMKNPDQHGLISEGESTLLKAVEDSLINYANNNPNTIYTGKITTRKQIYFYFYTDNANISKPSIKEILGYFKGYKYWTLLLDDESWSGYAEALYPADDEILRISNTKKFSLLSNQMNEGIEKEVKHTLYFGNYYNREGFIEIVEKEGFKIVQTENNTAASAYPFMLVIARNNKADLTSINEHSLYLMKLAKSYAGKYSDWELRELKVEN